MKEKGESDMKNNETKELETKDERVLTLQCLNVQEEERTDQLEGEGCIVKEVTPVPYTRYVLIHYTRGTLGGEDNDE